VPKYFEMNTDRYFSLGLTYYEIMDLDQNQLHKVLSLSEREEVILWLQWNDPNGLYLDKLSINEFGKVLSKEEAIEIVKRQILEA
jgi:hypothetical protein